MALTNLVRSPSTMMRIGLIFLIVGMLSLHYLTRWTRVSTDLADGLGGLSFGLAIGCLLLSVRMRSRRTR